MNRLDYKIWGIGLILIAIAGILSYFYLILEGFWKYAVIFVSTLFVLLFFGIIGWIGIIILRIRWPQGGRKV